MRKGALLQGVSDGASKVSTVQGFDVGPHTSIYSGPCGIKMPPKNAKFTGARPDSHIPVAANGILGESCNSCCGGE